MLLPLLVSFLYQTTTSQTFTWATGVGSAMSDDVGQSVAVDEQGAVYSCGRFAGTGDFDPGAGTDLMVSTGINDAYVLKFDQCISNITQPIVSCRPYTWIDGNTYTSNNNTASFLLANSAGCDSVIFLDLTISPVDNGVLYTDDVITAVANGANYQWLDCANEYSVIPEATEQSFTAAEAGIYAVQVIENGCVDTSVCVTISTVSTVDKKEAHLSFYPNPSHDRLYILLPDSVADAEVRIRNLQGGLIFQQSLSNGLNELNVSPLAAGGYFLEFTEEGKLPVTEKLWILR